MKKFEIFAEFADETGLEDTILRATKAEATKELNKRIANAYRVNPESKPVQFKSVDELRVPQVTKKDMRSLQVSIERNEREARNYAKQGDKELASCFRADAREFRKLAKALETGRWKAACVLLEGMDTAVAEEVPQGIDRELDAWSCYGGSILR